MANKDIEKLVDEIEAAGWRVDRTAKNYRIIRTPDGEFVTRIPSTPSSRFTITKIRTRLTRAGFPWRS